MPAVLVLFVHELLVDDLDNNGGGGAALENRAPLGADEFEGVQPVALHLRRDDLELDPREVLGRRPALGLAARVLRDDLLLDGRLPLAG